MRIDLSEKNMDLVMYVVRKYKFPVDEAVNYLLNNPNEIMSTRGVLNGQKPAKSKEESILWSN